MLALKGKVFAIRASLALVIVPFGLVAFAGTKMPANITSILTGTGSSAIVTLIVYAVEYLDTRVRTLENMWSALQKVNNEFLNITYLHFEEPVDLIQECYHQMHWDGPSGREAAQKTLANYYLKHNSKLTLDAIESYRMAIRKASKRLCDIEEQIEKVMDQYLKLSQTSTAQVNNIYGEIYFLMGNKTNRNINIYRRLLELLNTVLRDVKITAFHFNLHKNGEVRNLAVMLDYILKLQATLFRVEEKGEHVLVFNEYYDRTFDRLETFRASIYQQAPQNFVRSPRISIYKSESVFPNLSDNFKEDI